MTDLELQLRDLGAQIEYPRTPDIAGAVRRRLTTEAARRGFALRRAVLIGVAVLAVVVGAVMAVPQARTAVLEWLGLRGVKIERVPTQPTAPVGSDLGLGERVTLDEARRRAGYEVTVPHAEDLGEPEVYSSTLTEGAQTAFVYGDDGEVRVLVTEFVGSLEREFIRKSAGPDTRVESTMVNGEQAYWLEGAPHEFMYVDENGVPFQETLRLATNTLLWTRGQLTLRIEGDLTKTEALRIAESVR